LQILEGLINQSPRGEHYSEQRLPCKFFVTLC